MCKCRTEMYQLHLRTSSCQLKGIMEIQEAIIASGNYRLLLKFK